MSVPFCTTATNLKTPHAERRAVGATTLDSDPCRQTGWVLLARVFGDRFPELARRRTVKASRFSNGQKAFVLNQGANGMSVVDIWRKAGIIQATYFNGKKYDGCCRPTWAAEATQGGENAKLRDRRALATHREARAAAIQLFDIAERCLPPSIAGQAFLISVVEQRLHVGFVKRTLLAIGKSTPSRLAIR